MSIFNTSNYSLHWCTYKYSTKLIFGPIGWGILSKSYQERKWKFICCPMRKFSSIAVSEKIILSLAPTSRIISPIRKCSLPWMNKIFSSWEWVQLLPTEWEGSSNNIQSMSDNIHPLLFMLKFCLLHISYLRSPRPVAWIHQPELKNKWSQI